MADPRASTSGSGWRTVDIVVAAVIAVAFGVVFWAWNALWAATEPAFAALPQAQYLISGVWLIPAVLGGFIIRKPGAALFCELLAAIVSALIGSQWGLDTIVSGVAQGGGAELIFLLFGYKNWSIPVAALAGLASAGAEWVHDMIVYYPDLGFSGWLVFMPFYLASAAVIAGIGSYYLVRSLAQTGVLASFPSGRAQNRV
ncbi:MAG TPA: ECF transporter S component [Candidatus Limnocylindria bacterium]|jgi:energy-coupling factor transport system substrate-specific component